MLRIRGSLSAENCVKAAETKLLELRIITEKHIVACVTDGAIMMIDLEENPVEDKSHEEDNDESEELVEGLDKALDLEFESGTSPNDRDKAFLRRRGIDIQLFTLRSIEVLKENL
ncbi:hypothetical protein TNCV_367541 [Trichonephila clavipes]|nr:hypothetical protein TNCV_367541 [Trichonephila clavipes]